MRKKLYLMPVLILALLFTFIISSCSKPADEEIMAAEDAIKAARDVGAEDLVPKLFDKSVSLLQEAKMLNEQTSYDQARKKADFSKLRAEKACKEAKRLNQAHKKTDDEELE